MTDNEPIYASLGWHDLCSDCNDWNEAVENDGFPITLIISYHSRGGWNQFILQTQCNCFGEKTREYTSFNDVDSLVTWLQNSDLTANLYLDRRVLQQWGHLRKNDS